MRKKTLIGFVLIAAIVGILISVFSRGSRLSAYTIENDQYETIISSRKLNSSLKLDELFFNEYPLFIDNDNNYYYSIVESDNDKYNPLVKYNDDLEFRIILDSTIDENIIQNNLNPTIIVYNENEYNIFKLVFTTLPVINIDAEQDEILDDKVNIYLSLFDNRDGQLQRLTNSEGTIHIRGNGTRYVYEKKGYKIELTQSSVGENTRENNIALLGLHKDGDYVLYAAMSDETKVRNVFTANLWKESCATDNKYKVDNGVEYKYVELILNGKYEGLYALGYGVNSDMVSLENNEIIYKKSLPQYSEYEEGFIDKTIYESYEIYKKGTEISDDWQMLIEYYRSVLEGRDLDTVIDLNNGIDIYLFVNMIQGIDHWMPDLRSMTNIFLTAKYNYNHYEMLMTPWDFDRTWGFNTIGSCVPANLNIIFELSPIHNLIYSNNDFKANVIQKYYDLRNSYWSDEHLTELLDEYEKEIFGSGAYLRDINRWPDEDYTHSLHYEDINDLSEFKTYVLLRMSYMDKYIEKLSNS